MSELDDLKTEVTEIKTQMRMVTQSLVSVSEANGCALDALLALLPTLGPAGLLEKKGDAMPFMAALKAQHAQLHSLNKTIASLIESCGIDGLEQRLSPKPDLSA